MNTIRKGYKQTDIGVIPEDWRVIHLGDIADITKLAGFEYSKYFNSYKDGGDIIVVRGINITNNYLDLSDVRYIPQQTSNFLSRSQLRAGDLVFAYVGTIGPVFLITENNKYHLGPNTCKITSRRNATAEYLFSYFKSSLIKHEIAEYVSIGAQPSLSMSKIRKFLIILPKSLEEQKTIGKVLNDIDSLIEALDKKIAKKRAIKDGSMQQLLTGKKRLAGFTGQWEEVELGEIFDVNKGTQVNRANLSDNRSEYPAMNGGIEPSGYIDKYNSTAGTIIISEGGNSCGYVNYMNLNFWAGGHCYVIFPKMDIDIKYLYATLKYNEPAIMQLRTGSGLPNIQKKRLLEELTIILTPDIKEQKAIARILTDMDDEIEQLEKQRAKYTVLKQGAMQKLLTGQIRLMDTLSQQEKVAEVRTIPVDAHVVAGHIVNKLHSPKGLGRTKLQKSLHLVGYCCQLDFGNEYIRNTAGPDDQGLMNHIDSKFKQYRHVRIDVSNNGKGGKIYNYTPTAMISEVEQVFESYPAETQQVADELLSKIKTMDLARVEIVSTLYAVWNNRIIKEQPISDDLLLADFYDWSAHKSDFDKDLVLRALSYMRRESIIPVGWGKYIDKK